MGCRYFQQRRVDIDLVLKVPDRDYDASAQPYHLERALKHDYMGVVVFAGEVHQLTWSLFRRPNIRTTASSSGTTPVSSASWLESGW